jgi:hypothetical protein
MSDQLSSDDLIEMKRNVQDLIADWTDIADDLTSAKQELNKSDLFTTIDYLTLCDQTCKNIRIDLKLLDSQLNSVKSLLEDNKKTKDSAAAKDLILDLQGIRDQMQAKLTQIEEEYPRLADQTIRGALDLIASFESSLKKEKLTPNLNTEINQDLDKELYLEELKDSLESYREAREDYVSDMLMDYLSTLPEGNRPEDLGEEEPELDYVLSELDTAITSCDMVLLNQEIDED